MTSLTCRRMPSLLVQPQSSRAETPGAGVGRTSREVRLLASRFPLRRQTQKELSQSREPSNRRGRGKGRCGSAAMGAGRYRCSVAESCLTLCDPMDRSTPGSPVLHSPGACSNSCPLSQWCHPTISSSVVPFSSCLQSFPASGSFPMSQFFASGGQSIGASASASVLPMNIQS